MPNAKKSGAVGDVEWESSGIGPDDEDGDVLEGSGSPEGFLYFNCFIIFLAFRYRNNCIRLNKMFYFFYFFIFMVVSSFS